MMFGMNNAPLASKPSLGLYLILSTVGITFYQNVMLFLLPSETAVA